MAVISLVVLAGGSRWLEFFEKRISPVEASMVRAARELTISAGPLAAVSSRKRTARGRKRKKTFLVF
jgi:hypothetical protein